jgi:hypothetical protein
MVSLPVSLLKAKRRVPTCALVSRYYTLYLSQRTASTVIITESENQNYRRQFIAYNISNSFYYNTEKLSG